jgi:hypothetical protein
MKMSSQDDFLQEGLASYGKALLTIKQFEQLVQSECSAIMKQNVKELIGRFGIDFIIDSIKAYDVFVSNECVWLESGIEGKTNVEYFGMGLMWEGEELNAFGDLYVGSSRDTNRLAEALKNNDLEPYYDRKEGGYLILYGSLKERTWKEMTNALETVMREWLSIAPQYSKLRRQLAQ